MSSTPTPDAAEMPDEFASEGAGEGEGEEQSFETYESYDEEAYEERATVGYVLASKVVGDESMLNGPVDTNRYETILIDEVVWASLISSGLAEDFSVLAVGIIDRHEEGAIANHALERLISTIENKAAYVDEDLAYFLADLRDLALFALDRNVPILFTIE